MRLLRERRCGPLATASAPPHPQVTGLPLRPEGLSQQLLVPAPVRHCTRSFLHVTGFYVMPPETSLQISREHRGFSELSQLSRSHSCPWMVGGVPNPALPAAVLVPPGLVYLGADQDCTRRDYRGGITATAGADPRRPRPSTVNMSSVLMLPVIVLFFPARLPRLGFHYLGGIK